MPGPPVRTATVKKSANTPESELDQPRKIISLLTVGDPFLLSVYNVVLAVRSLLCLGLDVGDVTASVGLGDSQTNDLFTGQTLASLVAQKFGAEFSDRRHTDAQTSE